MANHIHDVLWDHLLEQGWNHTVPMLSPSGQMTTHASGQTAPGAKPAGHELLSKPAYWHELLSNPAYWGVDSRTGKHTQLSHPIPPGEISHVWKFNKPEGPRYSYHTGNSGALQTPFDPEAYLARARGLAKAEKKSKPKYSWLDRPLVGDHSIELENDAATLEFKDRKPRKEAEEEAYKSYTKKHRLEASVHHVRGLRAAQASGDTETARRHAAMFALHMKALGYESVGELPEEIRSRLSEGGLDQIHKFKAHPADLFEMKKEMSKAEPPFRHGQLGGFSSRTSVPLSYPAAVRPAKNPTARRTQRDAEKAWTESAENPTTNKSESQPLECAMTPQEKLQFLYKAAKMMTDEGSPLVKALDPASLAALQAAFDQKHLQHLNTQIADQTPQPSPQIDPLQIQKLRDAWAAKDAAHFAAGGGPVGVERNPDAERLPADHLTELPHFPTVVPVRGSNAPTRNEEVQQQRAAAAEAAKKGLPAEQQQQHGFVKDEPGVGNVSTGAVPSSILGPSTPGPTSQQPPAPSSSTSPLAGGVNSGGGAAGMVDAESVIGKAELPPGLPSSGEEQWTGTAGLDMSPGAIKARMEAARRARVAAPVAAPVPKSNYQGPESDPFVPATPVAQPRKPTFWERMEMDKQELPDGSGVMLGTVGTKKMENTMATDIKKAILEKVAPPGFDEKTMHSLKRKHGEKSAFKIAWAAHGRKGKGKTKKSEDEAFCEGLDLTKSEELAVKSLEYWSDRGQYDAPGFKYEK